jgi:hypothetical protein
MRPVTKIGPLTQLQDARSCAAVGFDLISFSLARGEDRKLPVSMVWSIVNWLSGPEIVLEVNRESLEELEEAARAFSWRYVSLPAADWSAELAGRFPALLLTAKAEEARPEWVAAQVSAAQALGCELKVELQLETASGLEAYSEVMVHLLLRLPSLEAGEGFLRQAPALPWGLSLGAEAEEYPGQLDYERIDRWVEALDARSARR